MERGEGRGENGEWRMEIGDWGLEIGYWLVGHDASLELVIMRGQDSTYVLFLLYHKTGDHVTSIWDNWVKFGEF